MLYLNIDKRGFIMKRIIQIASTVATVIIITFGVSSCSTPVTTPTKTVTETVSQSSMAKVKRQTPETELAKNQLEKFKYMNSPEHLAFYQNFEVQMKVLINTINSGDLGKLRKPDLSQYHASLLTTSRVYIELSGVNIVNGVINTTHHTTVSIMAEGKPLVTVSYAVHDWPTTIGNTTASLRYSVSILYPYGSPAAPLLGNKETCIWPKLSDERQNCAAGSKGYGTTTVGEMRQLDRIASVSFGQQLVSVLPAKEKALLLSQEK